MMLRSRIARSLIKASVRIVWQSGISVRKASARCITLEDLYRGANRISIPVVSATEDFNNAEPSTSTPIVCNTEIDSSPQPLPIKRGINDILRIVRSEGQNGKFVISDLLQALEAWGRSSKEDERDVLLREREYLNCVEIALSGSIATLPSEEARHLLHEYARVGRRYPPIINALNDIILQNVETMPIPQLIATIRRSAKLNDRNASYLPAAISRCLNHRDPSDTLVYLPKLLHSLAMLRMLDLATFETAKRRLEQRVRRGGGVNIVPLHFVWNEVKTLRKDPISEVDVFAQPDPLVSAQQLPDTPSQSPNKVGKSRSPLPWEEGYRYSLPFEGSAKSSTTHKSMSRILRRLGVPLRNEVMLENGYVVDILMPMSAFEYVASEATCNHTALPAGHKGVVIEYDGPTHFETYANAQLGPTAMKRRHIAAAGYIAINIPYWCVRHAATVKVVKRYFLEHGLRIKERC